ncbi:acetyltransferase (GNAT) family protein [Shewanella psychrophila]|uniref:Acetyltransferase (GNAT) family protein n=1 Tax=Shewanella psychrophila TaxID=225848 RepID=A0A1S6HX18_9GAMM|nr:GNAT family N-acetyltransferase [Shewanella psychrophila]AQS39974.1 acetyltransferase (GNAT) family protein [Shewanella psychrophila]
MELTTTTQPRQEDDEFVIKATRAYNSQFVSEEWSPVSVYIRNDNEEIIAGLTGKIFGNWLNVEFLWVSEEHRGRDLGSKVLSAAESKAIDKGCVASTLDTFSFQALGFYRKQGYEIVGSLDGYYENHQRHYLQKKLV